MRHAYESGASSTETPNSGTTEANDVGFPTDGDGADVQPTVVGAYWAHSVTSEIVDVITHAGLTPNGDDLGQLDEAIDTLIANSIAMISPPTLPDFATRNEHIAASPPGDEFANPRDALFAIRTFLAARA